MGEKRNVAVWLIFLVSAAAISGWVGMRRGLDVGYEAGWRDGYSKAYTQAYALGNRTGYELGFRDGNSTGYYFGEYQGYRRGYSEGVEYGNKTGFDYGLQIGFWKGFCEGNSTGFSRGYSVGFVEGNSTGFSLGFKKGLDDGLGHKFNIRDPTFEEALNFIREDETDKNEYTSEYTCWNFAADVKMNAFNAGFRCGVVYMIFKSQYAHTVVCFNTVDRGLIFIEPQLDRIAKVEVGIRYWYDNFKMISSFDDTIIYYAIVY